MDGMNFTKLEQLLAYPFSFIPERFHRTVRFLISGGSATVATISALYFFNSVLSIWYVTATVLAFCVGFVVSFSMQKFWTFKNMEIDHVKQQASVYLVIVLFNLLLNTALVYLLVENFDLMPVVAQLIASALIACESFFAYRILVFSRNDL